MAATGYTTGDPQKVDLAGDTMTGELVLPDSSPDTSLTAASRGYVDNSAQAVTAESETLLTASHVGSPPSCRKASAHVAMRTAFAADSA